jgi:hypothetical protein
MGSRAQGWILPQLNRKGKEIPSSPESPSLRRLSTVQLALKKSSTSSKSMVVQLFHFALERAQNPKTRIFTIYELFDVFIWTKKCLYAFWTSLWPYLLQNRTVPDQIHAKNGGIR